MGHAENRPEKILIVDDVPANIRILGQLLRARYDIRVATGGEKALAIAGSENPPDLVLLDIMMPGMDGYEVCRRLKNNPRSSHVPVIFITAKEAEEDETKGLETGAVDYIVKPFTPSIVMARVKTHLELKRQRDGLAARGRDLTELNQMKGKLLAVCSHDLRSPLNGILGFADLLLEKEYLEAEDKEGLTHIKTSGNLLLALVNDILDLSKARSEQVELELEPLSLSEVIRNSISSLKHIAVRKGQELHLEDHCPQAQILGNASGLGRVFNNLLSNAIKFTPEKGTIRVAIEPGPEGKVLAKVIDTGIGIKAEKIPYLFDPFTRTSQSGTGGEQGTGLGMSIVKEILEKHGVPIEVKSEAGKGTSFSLTFVLSGKIPAQSPDAAELPFLTGPLPVREKAHLKILLAEDNLVNRKLGEKMLAKEGHQVTTAKDGEEALTLYTATPEAFDLVFMDIQMPVMDGLEGAKAIREFEASNQEKDGISDSPSAVKRVPIVAMTGNAMAGDREKCLAAGMDDHMIKPISQER
ncbi:MAG: response regulator, partial [Deltaproteobacteria bacterium]|nr:response regulator [Deltaproteobacteria bacterium]